jgi:hypothetical protein
MNLSFFAIAGLVPILGSILWLQRRLPADRRWGSSCSGIRFFMIKFWYQVVLVVLVVLVSGLGIKLFWYQVVLVSGLGIFGDHDLINI